MEQAELAYRTGLIYERVRMGFAGLEEVVNWADQMIEALENPPFWLLDLATERRASGEELTQILEEHASEISKIERLKMTLREHKQSQVPLGITISRIFQIWDLLDRDPLPGTGDLPGDVLDLLVYLECWETEPPPLDADFTARCERVFTRVLEIDC